MAADPTVPAFVRASALNGHVTQETAALARSALSDPDPEVRLGALDLLEGVPAQNIWRLVAPLLSDRVRGLRIRAASLLASLPTESRPAADRETFDRAAQEFVAAQRHNADRPEARAAGDTPRPSASSARRCASARSSRPRPPISPISTACCSAMTRESKCCSQRWRFCPTTPGCITHWAGAHARRKRNDPALAELRRAAGLAPDSARYQYVYAVALQSVGHPDEAPDVLRLNLAKHGADRNTLMALLSSTRKPDGSRPHSATRRRFCNCSRATPPYGSW